MCHKSATNYKKIKKTKVFSKNYLNLLILMEKHY